MSSEGVGLVGVKGEGARMALGAVLYVYNHEGEILQTLPDTDILK